MKYQLHMIPNTKPSKLISQLLEPLDIHTHQTYDDMFHADHAKTYQAEQNSKSVNQTKLKHPAREMEINHSQPLQMTTMSNIAKRSMPQATLAPQKT